MCFVLSSVQFSLLFCLCLTFDIYIYSIYILYFLELLQNLTGWPSRKTKKHFNDIHINAVRDIKTSGKTYSISAIESSVCPLIKNLTSFTAAEKHMYWSISSSSLVSIISISVSRRNSSQKASDLHFTTTEHTPS